MSDAVLKVNGLTLEQITTALRGTKSKTYIEIGRFAWFGRHISNWVGKEDMICQFDEVPYFYEPKISKLTDFKEVTGRDANDIYLFGEDEIIFILSFVISQSEFYFAQSEQNVRIKEICLQDVLISTKLITKDQIYGTKWFRF